MDPDEAKEIVGAGFLFGALSRLPELMGLFEPALDDQGQVTNRLLMCAMGFDLVITVEVL
jgi:hypothetical protein